MRGWRVSEEEVRSVADPVWTKTWHPISHAMVLDSLELAVAETGMEVRQRNYSLAAHGGAMFGSWVLNKEEEGIRWMLGFRNSINKKIAVGVCAGTQVISCSNMQFKGDDFIEFQKHHSRLDWDEMVDMAKRAMTGLIEKMGKLVDWNKRLKERSISSLEFKALVFDMIKRNILSPVQFHNFIDSFNIEKAGNPGVEDTLFTFNGAMTRLLRDFSLFNINVRTTGLVKLLDSYLPAN